MDHVPCGNPSLGIWKFPNAIKNTTEVIDSIERIASGQIDGACLWMPAQVGHYELSTTSRKCFDWKPDLKTLQTSWDNLDDVRNINNMRNSIIDAVFTYSKTFRVSLGFMEVMNIIKYYEGDFFSYHSDDGHSYVSSVSSVAYLNDDYEGGGLHFNNLDVEIKPHKGDIIVFPSNFIYSHSALSVESGAKYSVVTMFDYNRYKFFNNSQRVRVDTKIERYEI